MKVQPPASTGGYTKAQVYGQMSIDTISAQLVNRQADRVYTATKGSFYSSGDDKGISFTLSYAEGSTREDPIICAMGRDENGDGFEVAVRINDISLSNATIIEFRAFEVHTATNLDEKMAELLIPKANMGLRDKANFIKDAEKVVDIQAQGQALATQFYQDSLSFYEKEACQRELVNFVKAK